MAWLSTSRSIWLLRVACLLQIGSVGVTFAFEAVHMRDRGLGETVIGLILGAANGVLILASLSWGWLADRYGWHRGLVVVGSLGMAGALVTFSVVHSISGFLGYALLRALSMPMIQGLMPILVVGVLGEAGRGRSFGTYRAFGSVGFIIATLILPLTLQDLGLVAQVTALILLLSIPALLALPASGSLPARIKGTSALKQPVLLLFLVCAFLMSTADPAVYGFFTAYARSLGADTALLGWVSGTMGIVALVALPTLGAWIDRIGPRFLLVLAFAAQPLRAFCASLITDPSWLWLVHFFHAFSWAGLEVASVLYVASLVGSGHRATALGAYLASRLLGNFAGAPLWGYIAEHHGYALMFRLASVGAALGFLLFVSAGPILERRRTLPSEA